MRIEFDEVDDRWVRILFNKDAMFLLRYDTAKKMVEHLVSEPTENGGDVITRNLASVAKELSPDNPTNIGYIHLSQRLWCVINSVSPGLSRVIVTIYLKDEPVPEQVVVLPSNHDSTKLCKSTNNLIRAVEGLAPVDDSSLSCLEYHRMRHCKFKVKYFKHVLTDLRTPPTEGSVIMKRLKDETFAELANQGDIQLGEIHKNKLPCAEDPDDSFSDTPTPEELSSMNQRFRDYMATIRDKFEKIEIYHGHYT